MSSDEKTAKSSTTIGNMQAAWNKGTEIGHDITISRQEQRIKLARRVKALRMERGISQEKFADAINANFLTYKGYENCKSDIPLFYLVRIADTLDTTLDYLAGRTDVKEAGSIEDRLKTVEDLIREMTTPK